MTQRIVVTFNDLLKEFPELERYKKEKISESIKEILPIVDEYAQKNNMKLFNILTPALDNVVFIFNKQNDGICIEKSTIDEVIITPIYKNSEKTEVDEVFCEIKFKTSAKNIIQLNNLCNPNNK